jgi:outer membrane protein TolC
VAFQLPAGFPAFRLLGWLATAVDSHIARQSYRPEWMLELAYGARYAEAAGVGHEPGARAPDMASVMVSFSLPLFTGNRQDRRVEAARENLLAAQYTRGERKQSLEGRLHRQLSTWARYAELVELYREEILVESRQTVETTMTAYQAARASFDELVRARINEFDQSLRLLLAER